MTVKPSAIKSAPRSKNAATLLIVLGVVGLSLLFATAGLTGLVAQPGFLGTEATMFSDLSLVAQFLLLVGLIIGYFFARRGNIEAHQYIQTGMVLFNVVIVFFVMIVGIVDYFLPEMPERFGSGYGIVTTLHAILGLATIFCGVYLLLHMNRILPKQYRIKGWRTLMRATLILYWLVGLIGLGVYYFWFMA